ncbi:MAG: protein kinase [Deltaproteobacteria bacterium]|nr:protein kinase [Deltaproteobacteria bacterium]
MLRGRFYLQERVGQGGMGNVWRALDTHTGRVVAVKVLKTDHSNATTLFLREVEALAELRHPNVVGYVDHGLAGSGEPYLAMEWLTGCDLESFLHGRRLSNEEVTLLAQQVLRALHVAHGRGLVHRDLKPANIFLCDRDIAKVKVLDFGVAKRVLEPTKDAQRFAVGTPLYMSPEQARGLPEIDGRSDLFALGSVLYECLCGVAPFAGDTALAVLAKVCVDVPLPIHILCPEVSPALEKQINRMLEKRPAERPANAEVLLASFSGLSSSASGELLAFGDSLSMDEQRAVVVLMSKFTRSVTQSTSSMPAVGETREILIGVPALPKALLDAFGQLDAQANVLLDGTLLVTCSGKVTASELAAKAARCALAVRRQKPEAMTAIALGKAVVRQGLPLGKLLDETSARLAALCAGDVAVDEEMAPLVARSFALRNHNNAWLLVDDSYATPLPIIVNSTERVFIGRDADIEQLERDFTELAANKPPKLVAYIAEAGVGKTRLASEWFSHLRHHHHRHRLWRAQGDSLQTARPFGLARQLAMAGLGIAEDTPRRLRREIVQTFLQAGQPDDGKSLAVTYLAELVGAAPTMESESILRSSRNDPRVMAEQTALALGDAFKIASLRLPLVLLLDDLQWADAASVKLLEGAFAHMGACACFVLVLARPALWQAYPRMWEERGLQTRSLLPLSSGDATVLIRELLPADAAPAVEWVAERAEGNPFFIEELSRTLRRRGRSKIPEAVLGTVQARLDDLPPPARRILRAASVYGRTFVRDALLPLLGEDDAVEVDRWLGFLVKEEILLAESGASFRFWHELTREAAYQSLTDGDRVLGHRLAGRWLEELEDVAPSLLFEHASRAVDAPRSCALAEAAAVQAFSAGDLEGAVSFATRAFDFKPEAMQRGRLRLLEAKALRWLGRMTEGQAPVQEAMNFLRSGSPDWYGAIECAAWIFGESTDAENLLWLAECVLTTQAYDTAAVDDRTLALSSIAGGLLGVGLCDRAEALLVEAERENAERLHPITRSRLLAVRGSYERRMGRLGKALRCYKRCFEQVAPLDDEVSKMDPRILMLNMMSDCGSYAEAKRYVSEGIASARRLRSDLFEGLAEGNAAVIHMAEGHLDEAATMLERAGQRFAGRGVNWLALSVGLYKAHLALLRGQPKDAWPFVQPFIADPKLVLPIRPYALALAAKAELMQNNVPAGLQLADQARRLIDDDGVAPEEREVFLRLVHVEALLASGQNAAARDILVAVAQRVQAQAHDIDDPTLAASFLQIPDHRRLFELLRDVDGSASTRVAV